MSSEESIEQVVPNDNVNSHSETVDTKMVKTQEQQVSVEITEKIKINGINITTNNGGSGETSKSTVEETVKIKTQSEAVTLTTTDITTTISETNEANEIKTEVIETKTVEAASQQKIKDSVVEQTPIEEENKEAIELSKSTEEEKSEEANKSGAKRGLPKWMVEDANAPPSPSEELVKKKEPKNTTAEIETSGATPARGRGRGRGRAATISIPATKNEAGSSKIESIRESSPLSIRPRRSTRAKIDYANPDAATVIAEVDDEEPGGLTRRSGRGTRASSGRGKKRKAGSESDEDPDEDGSSDYGAKKKKGSGGAVGLTGGRGKRGRPTGARAKSESKTKKITIGRGRKIKNVQNESDEEDESEVIYDDQESNNEAEDSPMEEDTLAETTKTAPASVPKITAQTKKRGRAAKAAPTSETEAKAEETH